MKNAHGDFIWYELMTTDAGAAQDFYGGLFGWTFADAGVAGISYSLFSADGPPVGGMLLLTEEMTKGGACPMWAGEIGVDDVDACASAIAAKGGEVLMGPQDIPGVARFAFMKDPQGAPFYIMRGESDRPSESFSPYNPRLGHCAWNELMTSDPAGARAFYGEVFGWVKADSMDMGPAGEYEMLKNGDDRDFMFGAMMRKPDDTPASFWAFYFRAPEIDAAADYVTANGGKVVHGPMEIPGGEFVFHAIDPQGAFFSLIAPRKN